MGLRMGELDVETLILKGDLPGSIIRMIADKTGISPDQISIDSRLYQDLGMTGDDAGEFLADFAEAFQVDLGGFRFSDHFTGEPPDFWVLIGRGPDRLIPVTVRDLVNNVATKKWTYAMR